MSEASPTVKTDAYTFYIGSPFLLPIEKVSSNEINDDNARMVHVSEGACLKLSLANLEILPNTSYAECKFDIEVKLYVSSSEIGDLFNVICFRCSGLGDWLEKGTWNQSLLGMDISGPRAWKFWMTCETKDVDYEPNIIMNVFGSIVMDSYHDTTRSLSIDSINFIHEGNKKRKIYLDETNTERMDILKNEKCMNDVQMKRNEAQNVTTNLEQESKNNQVNANETEQENTSNQINETEIETETETKTETEDEKRKRIKAERKARKKAAKLKHEELREQISKEQGYHYDTEDTSKKTNIQKPKETPLQSLSKKSPFSERRLAGGILIKDLILGNGKTVKPGKRVAILYTGSLPNEDGKIFDRNQNRNAPLQFRVGTGEVIRGLERGLENMKLNGERTIIIPPNLGYGKKGSGKQIPGNATLEFHVKLVGVGNV